MRYPTKKAALAAYAKTARELAKYGQTVEATLHYARNENELAEYPDYILCLSDSGAIRCVSA